jgi:hypothetical protein
LCCENPRRTPKYSQNATEQEVDSFDRKSLEYSDLVVDENSLLEIEELALPTQAVIHSFAATCVLLRP